MSDLIDSKDLSTMTKTELLALIGEKDQLIEQQGQKILDLDTKIGALKASQEGWLIVTPNPGYEGRLYDVVRFFNGQAFIPKDKIVPYFEYKKTDESVLEGMKPEAARAIMEREAVSSAERAAQALKDDFGYKVMYFEEGNLNLLQDMIDQRAMERVEWERAQAQLQEHIVRPGYMGA